MLLKKGGMSGLQGITSGKLKITGDLIIASELSTIFVKAGGVKRVMQYLEKHSLVEKGKEKKTKPDPLMTKQTPGNNKHEKFNIKSKL